jgi:hypothetical protein
MSIKAFSWMIFTTLAAIFGWLSISWFVSKYGWVDPVGGLFIATLLVWVIGALMFQFIALNIRPLALIETNGSYLYYEKKGELVYRGLFFKNYDLAKELRLTSIFGLRDLFRSYTFFPVIMKLSVEINFPLYGNAKFGLKAKNVKICFVCDDDEEKAMSLIQRYKNVYLTFDEMKGKISSALSAAAAVKVTTKVDSMILMTELKSEFIKKLEIAFRTELYQLNGNDFELSADIKFE